MLYEQYTGFCQVFSYGFFWLGYLNLTIRNLSQEKLLPLPHEFQNFLFFFLKLKFNFLEASKRRHNKKELFTFEISLILVSVVRGFSGGKLVALKLKKKILI